MWKPTEVLCPQKSSGNKFSLISYSPTGQHALTRPTRVKEFSRNNKRPQLSLTENTTILFISAPPHRPDIIYAKMKLLKRGEVIFQINLLLWFSYEQENLRGFNPSTLINLRKITTINSNISQTLFFRFYYPEQLTFPSHSPSIAQLNANRDTPHPSSGFRNRLLISPGESSGSSSPRFLLGRCFTTKTIHKGAVIAVARKVWHNLGHVDVQDADNRPNMFVLTFQSDKKRRQAWSLQPLVVSGALLSLKLWDGCSKMDHDCFRTIPLWVHFLDIPAWLRSEELINQITTSYFTGLISIDPAGLEQNRWTRAVRVFTDVPTNDPLLTNCELQTTEGIDHRIEFKYERIQPFCLYCGRLAHSLETCLWRRVDMASGLSGVPSGEYKPSLRVGVCSNASSEEEDNNAFDRGSISRRMGIQIMNSNSPASESSNAGNSHFYTEPYIHPTPQPLPDGHRRTTSPEMLTPTLQMLFPETDFSRYMASPLQPTNLYSAFESESPPNLHLSPMSPYLQNPPPGFEGLFPQPNMNSSFHLGESSSQANSHPNQLNQTLLDETRNFPLHVEPCYPLAIGGRDDNSNYPHQDILMGISTPAPFHPFPEMDLNLGLPTAMNDPLANSQVFEPRLWSPTISVMEGIQAEAHRPEIQTRDDIWIDEWAWPSAQEQKDGLLAAHSSSQSLSSCVVQNEILTEAEASQTHSNKVIDEELKIADDKVNLELSDATTIADSKVIIKKRKKPYVAGEQE
ncbi:hypothetical protein LINPERHAP2_LOCUS42985 [Linum perenne]